MNDKYYFIDFVVQYINENIVAFIVKIAIITDFYGIQDCFKIEINI